MATLLDLTARLVSQIYPFQLIEEQNKIIPEPVQRKIIFYSFPRDESYVLMYSNHYGNEDQFKFSNYRVENVIQIGFHLTGRVGLTNCTDEGCLETVSLNFDRCKITNVSCSCQQQLSLQQQQLLAETTKSSKKSNTNNSDNKALIFWCDHVVALAIYRIRNAERVKLRVPISETLLQMDRSQLQKLVQYLLSNHVEVLPTAQNLADDLLHNQKSKINRIHGAPDPTAGGSKDDDNSWALNEVNIVEQIRELYDERLEALIQGLFRKILLMLSASDTNGPRILTLITREFLSKTPPSSLNSNSTTTPPLRTLLWDQLSNLWKIVVMNPKQDISTRKQNFTPTLQQFISHPNIPKIDEHIPPPAQPLVVPPSPPSPVAAPANPGPEEGQEEPEEESPPPPPPPLPTILTPCLSLISTDYKCKTKDNSSNCLRVQALNAHGYLKESLNLSLKLLKTLRKSRSDNHSENLLDYDLALVVFNVLNDNNYANEALEFALINLGASKGVPPTLYLQEKHLKFEEKLINLLKINEHNKHVMENYVKIFLDKSYPSASMPLFNFAKFIYKNLQSSGSFKLCVKYLKAGIPSSYIQTSLEHQQVNLALLLINSSKGSKSSLETLLKSLTTLKSVSSVFRLAQESFRLEETNNNLIHFSFQLGLHVLKQTLKYNHRRRWDIVRWVMNSSLTCGFYQIIFLLKSWVEYFTPNEAVGTVANQFLSRGTSLRLNLNYMQQNQISEAARGVALVAMRHDPGNCALNGLTICESDPASFETSYQIILEAAKQQQNLLNCQQIFTIARYMEHRGYPLRAYKLAAIAIGHLHIPFNQETHSSISDIHWTCTLAQSLGDTELSNLLPVIISNIKCASVLSEILKRAAMEPPPRKCPRNNNSKIYNRLKLLVEATISSYVSTIHNRLTHISPRHYSDFIEYLSKAKECFLFAPDGVQQFRALVSSIKVQYKGKKKLLLLLIERFG